MKISDARTAAWRVLDVVRRGGVFEPALDEALSSLGDARDRALAAELARGCLALQARYDHLIDRFARRPAGVKPGVRLVLRLGLHQLLALDRVPDHAAVNESVNLARRVAGVGAKGFVNGLLQSVRRAAEGGGVAALRGLFPDPADDPVAHLAAWHSHPRWLVERWCGRFGADATEDLLAQANTPPPLDLHRLGASDAAVAAEELTEAGWPCDVLPGGCGVRLRTRPQRESLRSLLAERADLIVQDAAVQAATRWLGQGLDGDLLDLCAAPGGKTLHLRALLPDGAAVTAVDLTAARVDLLCESLARAAAGPVAVLRADARRLPLRDGCAGAVLLDGPCSGTGVIRHHPEGRWRIRPESPARNGARLLSLAREARRVLAPGGRLMYATCSLEPEENEDVLQALATACPDMAPEPGDERNAGRVWLPGRDGGDGFFAARWRKVG